MTLAISPGHGDLLIRLQQIDDAPAIVVIGAAALGHHVADFRGTADVDFVVVADSEAIRTKLTALEWTQDRQLPQRWRDGALNIVDVLPATANAIAAGYVMLADRKFSTVGFDLALAHAAPVTILGHDKTVDVASLASLIVLKMVAWLDRPHVRRKDLEDLGRVFEAAIDDWDGRRWEPPLAEIAHDDLVCTDEVDVAKRRLAVFKRALRLE